jgi:flagellar hook-associated protein 1 FlgK
MLQQQRDSVSGVSLDEEMTDMMKYQKAYEASAHLITTLDQMLETVLTMKQ